MQQPHFLAEDFVYNFDFLENNNQNKNMIVMLKKIILSGEKFIFHHSFEFFLPNYENYIQPDLLNKKFDHMPSNGSVEIINPYTKNPCLIVFLKYSDPLFKDISLSLKLFSKLEKREGFFVFYIEKNKDEWIIPIKQLSLENSINSFPIKIFETKIDIPENINLPSIDSIFYIFKNISFLFNKDQEYFFTYAKKQYKINSLFFKKLNREISDSQSFINEIMKKYKTLDDNLKKTYNRSVLKYRK